MRSITVLGNNLQSGAYLLRMNVRRDVTVRFGRFQGGRQVLVPQGEVVYAGSAMGQQGSMSLARRLLRHATRSDGGKPHQIREKMLKVFGEIGLGTVRLKPPDQKKLFWNIDYLLEEDVVDLSHVVIVRTTINFEDDLAHFLASEPVSGVLAKGLGAHDKRGRTHILSICETAEWWRRLPKQLERLLNMRLIQVVNERE